MIKKQIFLASSSKLKKDRQEFEIFINRKNKEWYDKGVFLELVIWEDFLDALSQSRLQDEYNKAIQNSDICLMLFSAQVTKYTEEEFETALQGFKSTNKPLIFTYFKDVKNRTRPAGTSDHGSLQAFQQRLSDLGHFYTKYKNTAELQLKFSRQLEKLAAKGFIEVNTPANETEKVQNKSNTNSIKVRGDNNITFQEVKTNKNISIDITSTRKNRK